MNLFTPLRKWFICLSVLLFSASASFAQSPATILEEWPFSVDASDSAVATGVVATTPTLTHLYLSNVYSITTAYSPVYGEAFGANSNNPGDGWWKNSPTGTPPSDGPGGALKYTYYQEFLLIPAATYTMTVDSFYLTDGFFSSTSATSMMGQYSKSHFRTDSSLIATYSWSPTADIPVTPAYTVGIPPTAANNDSFALVSGGGVVVLPGDTLTVRLYFTCSSSSTGRYACLKDVIVTGSIAPVTVTTVTLCLPTPGAFTTYNTSVCQGATGITYTIPPVVGATSYTWIYSGTGASFSSTTNSVSINYSSGATSGVLSVVANGPCGYSLPGTLNVNVNSGPSASVTGGLCVGGTLTVSATPNAASLVWGNTTGTLLTSNAGWNPNGITVAGTSGSAGSSASQLNGPSGMYVDASGNIYVADKVNDRIQKWAPAAGSGTTVAGNTLTTGLTPSTLNYPNGVYLDASGNIYISDLNNNRVQEWAPGATSGTTVAGTGISGSSASQLSNPFGVSVDANGNIYTADINNVRVQEWAPGATSGTTVAGTTGSSGSAATQLSGPNSPFVDGSGNVYVSDNGNQRIQKWAPGATSGITVAGTSGSAGSALTQLDFPTGEYVDGLGNIYIADNSNQRIVQWAPGAITGTLVAGVTGSLGSSATQFQYPTGIYLDKNGNIYVGDYNNARVQEFLDTVPNTYTTASAGNYSVIVTGFNGCASVETFTVTGTPVVAGITTGTTTICSGGTTTLSDVTTGGTWISGNTGIATVSGFGVVTGVSSGTVAITYSVTTECGSASTFTVITVTGGTISAGTITGPGAVCAGSSTTLSDATGVGTWSSSNTGIASVNASGSVTGISSGTVAITYSVTGSCGSASTYTVVTVTPIASVGTISGTTATCIGGTTTLTDAGSTGTTATWSSSNTGIASVNASGTVTGISSGTVAITFSVSGSCGSASTSAIVTISSAASAGSITGTSTVCPGSSTTLSDGVGTGIWSSSNTGIASINGSGIVTGISSGTVVITYSVTGGSCGSASTTIPYTVEPLPLAGTISGTTVVCAGVTTTFTDAGSAGTGTWSSSNTGVATVGASSGIVYGVASGVADIIFTASNSCGSVSTFSSISVSPPPFVAPITGSATVCAVSATTLGDVTPGGVWNSSNNSVAIIDGLGNVSALSPGASVITYSVTNGCGSSSAATLVLFVNPDITPSASISVSPSRSVCAASPATFTAIAVNGGTAPSFTWVVNGVNTASGSTYTYIPSNGDIVSSKLNSNIPCSAVDTVLSNSITITVDTNAVIVVTVTAYPGTITSVGEDVILRAIAPAAGLYATYQWYINGVLVVGATSPTYNSNTIANGDSISCAVSPNSCGGTSFGYVIMHVYAVSVNAVNSGISDIELFPNPNKGNFTISGNLGTPNDQQLSLEVTNMLGQVVYKKGITAQNGVINEPVSLGNSLANGMYTLSISLDSDSKVFHFVIGK